VPLWRNIRRLSFLGPVLGVQNPGPLDVVTPAQGVAILDDATWAVAPPEVPQGFVRGSTVGPPAGQHSGVEFVARAGGLHLLWAQQDSTNDENVKIWRGPTAAALRVAGTRVVTWGVPNGERPESDINEVRILTANVPTATAGWKFNDLGAGTFIGLFLQPGESCLLVNVTATASFTLTIGFREVPTRIRA